MTRWNHIHLEAYCMYDSCKDKISKYVSIDDMNKLFDHKKKKVGGKIDWMERPNPLFIDSDRPKWCKKKFGDGERTPCSRCLIGPNNITTHKSKKNVLDVRSRGKKKSSEKFQNKEESRCPFIAITDCDKEDHLLFDAVFEAMNQVGYDEDGDKIRGAKTELIKEIGVGVQSIGERRRQRQIGKRIGKRSLPQSLPLRSIKD